MVSSRFCDWIMPLHNGSQELRYVLFLSFYDSLRRAFNDMGLRSCNHPTLWFKAVPTKVRILTWRMNLNRLPTKVNLIKKGVVLDNMLCPFCQSCPETTTHIFEERVKVQEVRRLLNAWWRIFPDVGSDSNGQNTDSRKAEIAKEVVRYAFRWIIWRKRNETLFNEARFIPSFIANDIQACAFLWFHNRCVSGSYVSWAIWSCSPSSL